MRLSGAIGVARGAKIFERETNDSVIGSAYGVAREMLNAEVVVSRREPRIPAAHGVEYENPI